MISVGDAFQPLDTASTANAGVIDRLLRLLAAAQTPSGTHCYYIFLHAER